MKSEIEIRRALALIERSRPSLIRQEAKHGLAVAQKNEGILGALLWVLDERRGMCFQTLLDRTAALFATFDERN